MIIFVHIPKTAGTSIKEIFRLNCEVVDMLEIPNICKSNDYLSSYLYENIKIDINSDGLVGHVPYGIHKIFSTIPSKVSYFTFLRHPVERWLSSFYFSQNEQYIRSPWNEYSKIYKRANHSLKKFAEICLEENWNCNAMVRQLSGLEDIVEIENRTIKRRNYELQESNFNFFIRLGIEGSTRLCRSIRYTKSIKTFLKIYNYNNNIDNHYIKKNKINRFINYFMKNFYARKKGFVNSTVNIYDPNWYQSKSYTNSEYFEFLEASKNNLQSFDFVGLGEDVGSEIKKLCKVYGWLAPDKAPHVRKGTYFRVKKGKLDKETLNLINEINKYDILLYKWCKEKFYE